MENGNVKSTISTIFGQSLKILGVSPRTHFRCNFSLNFFSFPQIYVLIVFMGSWIDLQNDIWIVPFRKLLKLSNTIEKWPTNPISWNQISQNSSLGTFMFIVENSVHIQSGCRSPTYYRSFLVASTPPSIQYHKTSTPHSSSPVIYSRLLPFSWTLCCQRRDFQRRVHDLVPSNFHNYFLHLSLSLRTFSSNSINAESSTTLSRLQ